MAHRFLSILSSHTRQATAKTLGPTRINGLGFQSLKGSRCHHTVTPPRFPTSPPPPRPAANAESSPQYRPPVSNSRAKFHSSGRRRTFPSLSFYVCVLVIGLVQASSDNRISTEGINRKWFDLDLEQKVRARNIIYQGSRELDYESWKKWTVRLSFKKNGKDAVGTGFFINLPDIGDKAVILTAGHNLIGMKNKKPTRVEELTVRIQHADGTTKEYPMKSTWQIFISDEYSENPDDKNAVYDYGAIIIPKSELPPGIGGFGFSIDTAYMDLEKAGVTVYTAGFEKGAEKLSHNNGKVSEFKMSQLFYKAKTEQGKSGGPVIMSYRDKDTVVGIHNYNDDGRLTVGIGNRGTKLSIDVLYDICRWSGAGLRGRSLKVENTDGPTKGLFLKLEDTDNGMLTPLVKLGKEGFKTAFDILPAYTPPGDLDSDPELREKIEYVLVHWLNDEKLYFFQILKPNEEMNVLATNILTERALVKFEAISPENRLIYKGIGPVASANPKTLEEKLSNPFSILTADDKDSWKNKYWLRLGGDEITDDDEGDPEFSEDASLGIVRQNAKNAQHCFFRFVDAN